MLGRLRDDGTPPQLSTQLILAGEEEPKLDGQDLLQAVTKAASGWTRQLHHRAPPVGRCVRGAPGPEWSLMRVDTKNAEGCTFEQRVGILILCFV